MRTTSIGIWLLISLLSTAGCGGSGAICDPGELSDALEGAVAGDTVTIGSCTINASVTVPAGVTLAGQGAGESTIVGAAGTTVVELTPGAEATTLRDLTVESYGGGVLAQGPGAVTLSGVSFDTRLGFAAEFLDLTTLDATDVNMTGPVTDMNAITTSLISFDTAATMTSTHGLVLSGVDDANLTRVTVGGFAFFGVLSIDSNMTWTDGGAQANLRTGLMVYGGSADLTSVDLSDSMKGAGPFAYGGVFANGADITSTGLVASGSDDLGLLHDGVTAHHTDLVADGNRMAGVWAQFCTTSFEISGAASRMQGNALAGVLIMSSSNVTVADALIDSTALARKFVPGMETTSVELGDGVQLVGSMSGITLRDLDVTANSRAGILIDLGGGTIDSSWLQGITVDGTGTELGVVVQSGTMMSGWDSGVARSGATAANDADFLAAGVSIDTIAIIGPNTIPAGSSP